MLLHLHVKNMALIDEIDIDFQDNLNIITGETGAGKSIIIGSIEIGLGKKVSGDMIREGSESALVELLFLIDNENTKKALENIGIILSEENELIISRKILKNRVINKINDETVTVTKLKEAAAVFLDMHAQHDQQSLLQRKNHMRLLDAYQEKKIAPQKKQVESCYLEYEKILSDINENQMDEEERRRQVDFLQYEINEIQQAHLSADEDEILDKQYRRMQNAKQIVERVNLVYGYTGYQNGAGDMLGRALKEFFGVCDLDEALPEFKEQLSEIDGLLNDFNREISDYMTELKFDQEEYRQIEDRLNVINGLKAKYGKTIPDVLAYLSESQEKYNKLLAYEEYMSRQKQALAEKEKALCEACQALTKVRKEEAVKLTKKIAESLADLNFLDVRFEMQFETLAQFTKNGVDDAYFVISTNKGQPVRPLWEVASGGELSRIMLALKSVLANEESIDTLIFDEIDVGISGRTAQKVSEKLNVLAKNHQVICITHLPQIAAMADSHYRIEKYVENDKTITTISLLDETESVAEIARLMGGVEITDTVINSAKEMKKMALGEKIY